MLVDGYNIIHAWDELKIVAQDVLEDARKNLIEILSDYAGFSGQEVIIVFDAHMVKDNVGIIKQYDNVKVVYTKEQETADHFIEKTATDLSKENLSNAILSEATILGVAAFGLAEIFFVRLMNCSSIELFTFRKLFRFAFRSKVLNAVSTSVVLV